MKQLNDRKFGLVVGGVCLLIALYCMLVKHHYLPVLFAIAALLILAGLFIPVALKPFNRLWHGLGEILGTINSYILLSLVYYLLLTPIALMMRIFGKQLRLKPDKGERSYWQKTAAAEAGTMKRQF